MCGGYGRLTEEQWAQQKERMRNTYSPLIVEEEIAWHEKQRAKVKEAEAKAKAETPVTNSILDRGQQPAWLEARIEAEAQAEAPRPVLTH